MSKETSLTTTANTDPETAEMMQKAKDWLAVQGLDKKLAPEEVTNFLEIAQAFKLNPFKREIWAIKRKDKMTIVIGYETFLKRAERSRMLDGWEWSTDSGSIIKKASESGYYISPESTLSATVKIWRKDWSHVFSHTIYLSEFCANSPIWLKSPRFMLQKTCASQAFRLCFPDELGGVYTDVEADLMEPDADGPKDLRFYVDRAKVIKDSRVDGEAYFNTILDFADKGNETECRKHFHDLERSPLICAVEVVGETKPTPEPVPDDELTQLRLRAAKGVGICFDQAKHAKASVKKHLGVDSIDDCQDVALLNAYVLRLELRYRIQSTTELADEDKEALLANLATVADDAELLNVFGSDLRSVLGIA